MLITAEELIRKSWRDYLDRQHEWMIFSLLIFAPTLILALAGSFGSFLNAYVPSTLVTTNLLVLIMVLISVVWSFWSSISLLHAAGAYRQHQHLEEWTDHYSASLAFLWPAIYTSIFVGVAILVGTVLLIVPGIIFAVWYYFSIYALVLNGDEGFAAMKSSKKLAKGRWWWVLWLIFAPNFLFGLAALVAQYILTTIFGSFLLSTESTLLVSNIVSAVLGALVAPLTTLAMVNLYFSLKENPVSTTPVQPTKV